VLTDTAPWVSDEKATLSDFDDRWVYLDVFGSWCPPCRRKQPKMVEIAGILEERGAVVVGMLLKDRPEDAATWLHANGGMAYPYVVLDAETERAWGITGAPMGFLISPEGRLERLCSGCADGPDGVESLVEAVSGPYPGRRSVR
jgi:thiol-disulfide isomerase/thioredoxin